VEKNILSLSDEILLLLSSQPLNFASIREILELFGYNNKKVIWSTLERLTRRGFLKKIKTQEGTRFSITKAGEKALPEEPTFIPTPDRAWDRKWRLVLFDIPEDKRRIRNQFTAALKEMGFAKIQNSVYLTVHDVLGRVWEMARSLGISEQIKTMTVERIDVPDLRAFAQQIWNLDSLNQEYQKFVSKNKNGYKGEEFTSEVLRFWLKRTKYEYLNILHKDPVLPKELLPKDWMGYEARKIWQQMEGILKTY